VIFSKIATDLILMSALSVLIMSGVLDPMEALLGFSNPGVMTIAVLYVVAAGLKETGAIQCMTSRLLGQSGNVSHSIVKVVLPSAAMSAFVNNTAVVAMFIPSIQNWARLINISVSKLLIPRSYAAILGGTCTLSLPALIWW
jgi:di/tricarboxylate transporter